MRASNRKKKVAHVNVANASGQLQANSEEFGFIPFLLILLHTYLGVQDPGSGESQETSHANMLGPATFTAWKDSTVSMMEFLTKMWVWAWPKNWNYIPGLAYMTYDDISNDSALGVLHMLHLTQPELRSEQSNSSQRPSIDGDGVHEWQEVAAKDLDPPIQPSWLTLGSTNNVQWLQFCSQVQYLRACLP